MLIPTLQVELQYNGCSSNNLIMSISNHTNTFTNRNLRYATLLNKLIWGLKDEGREYRVRWKIIDKGNSYEIKDKLCRLCNLKLFLILKCRQKIIKNSVEINSKCLPKRNMSFKNYKGYM